MGIVYFHDLLLDTKINYGKHKGKTIKQIIDENYMWIEWAMENIEGFALDEYAFKYLLEKQNIRKGN